MKGEYSALSVSVLAGALSALSLDVPSGELSASGSPFVTIVEFLMAEFSFDCEPASSPRDGAVPENCGAGTAACRCCPVRSGMALVAPGSIPARSGAGAWHQLPATRRHGWPGVLARNQHLSPKSHFPVVVKLVHTPLPLPYLPLPVFGLPFPSPGAAFWAAVWAAAAACLSVRV